MENYNCKAKLKRPPTALTVECSVCGAPAPDHIHFGGTCCYSCRAFFRRTVERMGKMSVICRTGTKDCEVTEFSKVCSACRFDKCLKVGMKVELLQGKRRRNRGAHGAGEESLLNRSYEEESPERRPASHHQGNLPFTFPPVSDIADKYKRYHRSYLPEIDGGAPKRDHTGSEIRGVIQRHHESRSDLQAIRHSVIQRSNTSRSAPVGFSSSSEMPVHRNEQPQYQHQHFPPMTAPYPTQMTRMINPSRTNAMLRQEARMMRYNAHMMIQQSRMLEAQADMMDAEEEDNDVYSQSDIYDGRMDNEADNNSCIAEQDSEAEDEPLTTPPSEMIPYQRSFLHFNQPPEAVDTQKKVSKNNDMNNIEKDIKNIIKSAGSIENIDERIFESKIFREADELLSLTQEVTVPPPKAPRVLEPKEPEMPEKKEKPDNEDEPVNLSSKSVDNEVEKKLQSFPLVRVPEFPLTNDEVTWSDKMYQNISNTMKLLIRPDFYQGIMDLQLGKINKLQFQQVMLAGRNLQSYSHLIIISNLPYFHDLSLRTQRFLIRANFALCQEIFQCITFFEQPTECWYEDTSIFPLRFGEYCKTFGVPEEIARKIRVPHFSTFIGPALFGDVEEFGRYFKTLKKAASLLEGIRSKGILGVLYAMGFYSASEEDLKNQGIPQEDIATIAKASRQLATVYKRIMINEWGWKKVAAGKYLTYDCCLSLLRSSSSQMGNAIRKRRQHALMMASADIANMSKIPKIQ